MVHVKDGRPVTVDAHTAFDENPNGIVIHLKEQSSPIVHKGVRNAYTKGPLYCCMLNSGMVYKYPINDIFRIIEEFKAFG